MVKEIGFDRNAQATEMAMARIFGSCESMFVTDTLQFDNYSKYVSTLFDPEEKKNTGTRSSRRTAKRHTSSGPGGQKGGVRFFARRCGGFILHLLDPNAKIRYRPCRTFPEKSGSLGEEFKKRATQQLRISKKGWVTR